ncbi:uncharacterized protein BDZ83DRAFT_613400 [Colletotrichum acutatum]|uniref:Uncharacterized protein n=1 Tax=Glomerella acutata TaxID=27357 RepID=A0AAD8UU56_GLOAC|nr:uncharacterized protein BDZ83DRAFT_613400 [Colletotrichum acutatum]KAK1727376.1 hypothetical protein BDZ83DRAFT_613400 [Colletotrichum acutatum]
MTSGRLSFHLIMIGTIGEQRRKFRRHGRFPGLPATPHLAFSLAKNEELQSRQVCCDSTATFFCLLLGLASTTNKFTQR